MSKSHLCDYSDAYMLFKWPVTTLAAKGGDDDKQVKFKNCACT